MRHGILFGAQGNRINNNYMSDAFFEHPILNSPYEHPSRHWELDHGQPTQRIIENRRIAEYITPLPKPKKRKGQAEQSSLLLDDDKGLSTQEQEYQKTAVIINAVRQEVEKWRALPNPNTWHVTPETARLLQHWRHHNFSGVRPFFCQVEAVETRRAQKPSATFLEENVAWENYTSS